MKENQVFTQEEDEFLSGLIPEIGRKKPREEVRIREQRRALETLAEVIRSFPSPTHQGRLGSSIRSEETLIEKLCSQDAIGNSLYIPSQVALGKTFLHTKINFLLMVKYTVESAFRFRKAVPRILELITFNIFSLMTEEALFSLVEDPSLERFIREKAAHRLIHMWDSRMDSTDNASVPVLNSMWQARQKLCPVFGSMMGMSEIYQISRFVDPVWFDFLKAHEHREEAFQALEEFIFNLSFEEITRIREEMDRQKTATINRRKIEALVGRSRFCPDLEKVDPRELLRYYKERKKNAEMRSRSGIPGPGRTIEEYLLLYLLEKEDTP